MGPDPINSPPSTKDPGAWGPSWSLTQASPQFGVQEVNSTPSAEPGCLYGHLSGSEAGAD